MSGLMQLYQGLPAELQDKIKKEVLTADKSIKDIRDKTYTPPVCLQVDRASRQLFAHEYYANTIFLTDALTTGPWLRSLPRLHFDMLKEIQCIDTGLICPPPEISMSSSDLMALFRNFHETNKDIAYGIGKHFMRDVQASLWEDEEKGLQDMRPPDGVIRWKVYYYTESGNEDFIFWGERHPKGIEDETAETANSTN